MKESITDHETGSQIYRLQMALIIFFTAGIMITCAFVFLNGDDYMFACFSKHGVISSVSDYYISGNGRFWLNALNSLLLSFDRYPYVFLCPLIVLAFIYLI